MQVYSLAYMHGDTRFKRYYAYLSFFTAAMLGLVVSSNLLVTFCCWELVGFSSYILIGFWFERAEPPYAAEEGVHHHEAGRPRASTWRCCSSSRWWAASRSRRSRSSSTRGYMPAGAATAIGLGLLCGAAGKSAQFPLFIWLPDAMEGPTPVSALIHAATMVAAGIYLVAKCYFIFAASPMAMFAVAWVGALTAFMAATMAVVCYDIKRVLAFSTVSQLGFMMCALGCWGFTAGLFHLTTHAAFKALLFLCAGSVIHAVHTNDMRQMGGLSKKMPFTFLATFVGTCAISGIPFALRLVLQGHDPGAGLRVRPAPFPASWPSARALTAFYMFRLLFLTFLGTERDLERYQHAHESPGTMTVPLGILAVLPPSSAARSPERATRLFEQPRATSSRPPAWLAAEPAPRGAAVAGLGSSRAAWSCAIGLVLSLYRGPDFRAAETLKRRLRAALQPPGPALLPRRHLPGPGRPGRPCRRGWRSGSTARSSTASSWTAGGC